MHIKRKTESREDPTMIPVLEKGDQLIYDDGYGNKCVVSLTETPDPDLIKHLDWQPKVIPVDVVNLILAEEKKMHIRNLLWSNLIIVLIAGWIIWYMAGTIAELELENALLHHNIEVMATKPLSERGAGF